MLPDRVMLCADVTDAEREVVRAAAKSKGVTVASFIRRAVNDALAARGAEGIRAERRAYAQRRTGAPQDSD